MRRSGFKGLVAAGLVATGIAASTSVVAASDMFLKLGNIKGESVDAKHKGEIDVLSWSWGASTGTARTRKGNVPVACIQDLAFTKSLDSATPEIITTAVTGNVVPGTVVLTMRKSGDKPQDFFILTMSNVTIEAYQTSASEGANTLFENVVLHFDVLKGEYRSQRPDGTLGTPVFFEVSGSCPQ